jgi:hypothetical protein
VQDQYGAVVQSQIVSDCRSMSQRSSGSEVASRQWQRVPEGVALPAGLEVPQSVGQKWSDSGLAVSCSLCMCVRSSSIWIEAMISVKHVTVRFQSGGALFQVATMPGCQPKRRKHRM